MKTINKKAVALLAVAAAALPSAFAYNLEYSYSDESQQYVWGTSKVETYDAAIRLDDPILIGKEISAVVLPLYVDVELTNIKVWTTTELGLDADKNNLITDGYVQEVASFSLDSKEIQLDTPFVIPEGGCYVGVSFDVDLLTEKAMMPLIVTANYIPGSFYLHTSRTYKKWMDYSSTNGAVLDMDVVISGKFTNNACAVFEAPDAFTSAGEEAPAKITVINHGINPIRNIDYVSEIGGVTKSGTIVLPQELPAMLGARTTVDFTLPAAKEIGVADYTFTITKVNGQDNTDVYNTATGKVNILSLVPVMRPVLEEWTGTQCPYCTRGLVGLEKCAEDDPENFIGISYHGFNKEDPMYMQDGATGTYSRSESNLTPLISGFPSAFINRVTSCDAYSGTSGADLGIINDLRAARKAVVNADVQVEAAWTNPGVIETKATVIWVQDPNTEKKYRWEFVVIAHDLYGQDPDDTNWYQYNNYTGSKGANMEGMEWFSSQPFVVKGYHFNDVAVMKSSLYGNGVEGSVATPVLNTPDSYTYTFDTANCLNISGNPIIQNPDNLEVVAMLLEENGNYGVVVNANKCKISGDSGVKALGGDAPAVSEEYFTLSGFSVKPSASGLYIKVTRYADGTRKAEKVMLKK